MSKRDPKKMRGMVESMATYWNSYAEQSNYESYSVDTFIDDALYSIGIALDEKDHQYASGFRKFKQVLKQRLENEKESA